MQFLRQSNNQTILLNTDSPLAAGGEAHVYSVASNPGLVAKNYRRPAEHPPRKLTAMVANPPVDPMAAQGHISIAWPVDLLTTLDASRRVVGYLMPRVADARPLNKLSNPFTRRAVSPLFNTLSLLRTGRNLAAAMDAVHAKGYVIGNVNESHILVNDSAVVTLVDTDSYQVHDPDTGDLFRCPPGKPELTPPELQGGEVTEIVRMPEHDRFGLAVLIFQLLMEGTHPFAGKDTGMGGAPAYGRQIQQGLFAYGSRAVASQPLPMAPAFETLPPGLRELFVRCFDAGHSDPAARPDAATWVNALQAAENDLVACSVNDQHRYGRHLSACPWCARTMRLNGHDPFPSREAVQRGAFLEASSQTSPGSGMATAGSPAPEFLPIPRDTPPRPQAPSTSPLSGPAITTTRPVAAPPPRRWPSRLFLTGCLGLVALVVVVPILWTGYLERERVAWQVSSARVELSASQETREKLCRPGISSQQVADYWEVLQSRNENTIAGLESVLSHDSENQEAKQLYEEAKRYVNQCTADYEAVQARLLLDDVVQSIEMVKNRSLTRSQSNTEQQAMRGMCRAALDHCTKALSLKPQTVAAWVQRVRAHRLIGDTTAARTNLKKALALFPGDTGLQEQKRLLK